MKWLYYGLGYHLIYFDRYDQHNQDIWLSCSIWWSIRLQPLCCNLEILYLSGCIFQLNIQFHLWFNTSYLKCTINRSYGHLSLIFCKYDNNNKCLSTNTYRCRFDSYLSHKILLWWLSPIRNCHYFTHYQNKPLDYKLARVSFFFFFFLVMNQTCLGLVCLSCLCFNVVTLWCIVFTLYFDLCVIICLHKMQTNSFLCFWASIYSKVKLLFALISVMCDIHLCCKCPNWKNNKNCFKVFFNCTHWTRDA